MKNAQKGFDMEVKQRKVKGESTEEIRSAIGVPSVWALDGMIQAVIKGNMVKENSCEILKESVKTWTWQM
eukprot:12409880-Karenia_brevis.AAC.1